ncbi:Serine/threonine protein kinase PrkC, regulator of stationary phase [Labilithrix luteola]|uniref:non-specific serine/threonine protein kinase n=1 Tax=Labilithrix luteola TaxID=1391654 RepID=A0A0K1QH89_9BACT|nr:Serine/threonine protein kinase PrkC, regulator of stationary phase [Labilithrix luteola]
MAGKYRVEKIIGEGAMGYVLGVYHLELEERLAIKWVRDVQAAGQQAIDRFLREAKLCAKIQSEHVVRVRDVARTDAGTPFIVMELLDGHDLSALVEGGKRVPPPLAVDYVVEACDAVAEAHQLGIVHRDLKLANLFLARRKDGSDVVKVLDFGISKVTSTASMAMTAGTAILGSPLYMSPEQWRSSKDVDARSDIWSLGVVLFELLTSDVPFVAESLPQLCMQITNAPARDVMQMAPGVPEGLARVVHACLEKDPAHRPQNVGAMARALAPYATPRSRASLERISRMWPTGGIHEVQAVSRPQPSSVSLPAFQAQTLVAPEHLRPPMGPAGHMTAGQPPTPSSTLPNWAASQGTTASATKTSRAGLFVGGGVGVVAIALAAAFGLKQAPPKPTPATSVPSVVTSAPLPDPAPVVAPAPSAEPARTASTEPVDAGSRAAVDVHSAAPSPKTKAPPKSPPATTASSYAPKTPEPAPAATNRDLGNSRR